jgi:AmiR/NasT family two-component response regulator
MNVMGQEFKPARKVYIKEKINPMQLQKDPLNFGYVIVQVCSDISKSVEECSETEGNLIIVIADN